MDNKSQTDYPLIINDYNEIIPLDVLKLIPSELFPDIKGLNINELKYIFCIDKPSFPQSKKHPKKTIIEIVEKHLYITCPNCTRTLKKYYRYYNNYYQCICGIKICLLCKEIINNYNHFFSYGFYSYLKKCDIYMNVDRYERINFEKALIEIINLYHEKNGNNLYLIGTIYPLLCEIFYREWEKKIIDSMYKKYNISKSKYLKKINSRSNCLIL